MGEVVTWGSDNYNRNAEKRLIHSNKYGPRYIGFTPNGIKNLESGILKAKTVAMENTMI